MNVGRRLWRAAAAIAIVAAAAACPAGAAGTVRSEVDARKIGLEDQVRLTITVEGSEIPDQIAVPALTNLRVVGGPSVSTQMSMVNGRVSQSRNWTYALQPVAVGRAEIGAAKVTLGSGEATAPAIPIDVVAGRVKPPPPARRASGFEEDPFAALRRGRGAEPQLFVEAKASRGSLFVGEPLLLTYYLYTQVSVSGVRFEGVPQFTGFWAEDVENSGEPTGEPATAAGVPYQRFPVFKKLLFPTRAGRLTIPASELGIRVARQSLFDAGGMVQRSTKPVTVEVLPIPDEPGFSGAVGSFRATTTLDRSTLALGDAATLRFKVEGSGNLKWIDRAPEVVMSGAKVYPPQVKSNFKSGPEGVAGARTWEFVIVPQTAGSLEVPPLDFTYFDPVRKRIVRSETKSLGLEVAGGAPGVALPVPVKGPATLGGGSLSLRSDLDQGSGAGAALSGKAVAAIAALVLVLHGVLWGGGPLVLRLPTGAARTAATRDARSALRDLERVGRAGMSKEAAAGLIEKTIHGVFGPVDGDPGERSRAVRNLLDEVHAVRYAPQLGDYSERLRELATHAGEVIRRWG